MIELIIISIGTLAIVLYFALRIPEVEDKWKFRLFLASILWWSIILFTFPPHGFNYDIYAHNAELTLSGKPAFGREALPEDGKLFESPRHPGYLDYTGATHLIYVGLKFFNLSWIHPALEGFGFQIWSIIMMLTIIILINLKNPSLLENTNTLTHKEQNSIYKVFPILVLAFHPIFAMYWVINGWEDKLSFLAVPLVIVVLIEKKYNAVAAFLLGCSATLNGIIIFTIPAFIMYMFRIYRKEMWKYVALLFVGMVITALPFFPESIHGWQNRITRMNINSPFWFSIYHLLPRGMYTATLNKFITLFLAITLNIGYWFKRLNLSDVMIGSMILVLVLGPFNVMSRTLPIIMFIALLTPNQTRMYWMWFSMIVSTGLWLIDASPSWYSNVVLFHMPLAGVLFFYIHNRIRFETLTK